LAKKSIVLMHMEPRGDTVFGIWRVLGTHSGDFYGVPATGRDIDVIEVGLWRLENELITEAWYFGDGLGFLRQAGLTI
ncbi:MAG: ester cyclase, partial [Acidimicrobiia bacterium]|nr:ester cyclase [Acidimicrobiia bacterium]